MIGVGIRLVALASVLAATWLAVAWWERRRPRRTATGLPTGLVLVVGGDCRLCGAALRRFASEHTRLTVIEVTDPRVRTLAIRSLPTALVMGADGRPLARRSGRSVLGDAELLVARAGSVA